MNLQLPLVTAVLSAGMLFGGVTYAGDRALGVLLATGTGAAIGHSIGGRDGAAIGATAGALVGIAIANQHREQQYQPQYGNGQHRPYGGQVVYAPQQQYWQPAQLPTYQQQYEQHYRQVYPQQYQQISGPHYWPQEREHWRQHQWRREAYRQYHWNRHHDHDRYQN